MTDGRSLGTCIPTGAFIQTCPKVSDCLQRKMAWTNPGRWRWEWGQGEAWHRTDPIARTSGCPGVSFLYQWATPFKWNFSFLLIKAIEVNYIVVINQHKSIFQMRSWMTTLWVQSLAVCLWHSDTSEEAVPHPEPLCISGLFFLLPSAFFSLCHLWECPSVPT